MFGYCKFNFFLEILQFSVAFNSENFVWGDGEERRGEGRRILVFY